jgi:glycosyltransferase involved in cell wall biosynthesis
VTVGETDANWLRRIGGRATSHAVPNGVDVGPDDAMPPEAERPTLSFVGTLNYGPNVDAALFAARSVWPLVRRAYPEAQFLIAGRNPVAAVVALDGREGISVLPDVPDMTAVLGRSWVSVAPMRRGVGIKNKVLEAWAAGRPVVMTRLATNGLTLPAGHGDLVCAHAGSLAGAVVGLFGDNLDRRAKGAAARAHVLRHFTWDMAAARIDALLWAARPRTPHP